MNVSWQPSQCRPACASQAMFLKRDKGTCYVLSFCTTQQGDASLDSELRQELQGVSKWCGDPCLTIGGNLFEEIYWRKYIKAASSPRQVVNWMNHARSCPTSFRTTTFNRLGRYSCYFKAISVFPFFGGWASWLESEACPSRIIIVSRMASRVGVLGGFWYLRIQRRCARLGTDK